MAEYTITPSGCWLWPHVGTNGYGFIRDGRTLKSAHREFYARAKGAIPDGMDLDHLCRTRACVNPDHLEPVSRLTNAIRGAKTIVPTVDASAVREAMRQERTAVVARRFGISDAHAVDIAKGRRRLDASGSPVNRVRTRFRRKARIGREETEAIRALRRDGSTLQAIGDRFGISISYASQIATGALDRRYGA